MSHHAASRRDYLLTANGGCFIDDQLLEDSLHSYLQVICDEVRTTFCVWSPRASVLIVGVTDMQPTKELLHLFPSNSTVCGVILQPRYKLHPRTSSRINVAIGCRSGIVHANDIDTSTITASCAAYLHSIHLNGVNLVFQLTQPACCSLFAYCVLRVVVRNIQRYLHSDDTRVSVVLAIRSHLRKHIINQLYLFTERMVIVYPIIVELVTIHRAGEV